MSAERRRSDGNDDDVESSNCKQSVTNDGEYYSEKRKASDGNMTVAEELPRGEIGDRAHNSVKSTAIVKYASTEMPVGYHELQPNTNLNNPPSNWLEGNTKWESYIQSVLLGHERSFSSFRMAHGCLELTGEVDVVSDSENIKKLLKMPFSGASVSQMVHRIGNTLMLDDFDVHRHLLRQQEDDWKWLRKFFYETILNNVSETQRDKWIARKNKSRDHLQNRNMFSKFLYYSTTDVKTADCSSVHSVDSSLESSRNQPKTKNASELPQQTAKSGDADHQRTVLWTFEDNRMLIGTDLPIFGGGTHPCISLRLRDMKKPINVLTGLDYWLDNLMCNVPELAMCYHDNGIVQSYELIKTEDIPNMKDSRFSPTVIKDVAQNILSFLKSNATKEGHTYWLFKGQDDDIVKLYDLTTLCSRLMDDMNANPFTVPVGILLYRVARNMWVGQKRCRRKTKIVHKLLTNCLQLLDAYKYSQLVTSAHYLLTDLLVMDNVTNDFNSSENDADGSRTEEELDECEEDECDDDDDGENLESSLTEVPSSVDVTALCVHEELKDGPDGDFASRYPPVPSELVYCSKRAIHHIAQGLNILKASTENTYARKNIIEEQAQCDPNTAIPLFFHSTNADLSLTVFSRSKDEGDLTKEVKLEDEISVCSKTNSAESSWQSSSRVLLLRKAALSFFQLAKAEYETRQVDSALRLIAKALYCFTAIKKYLKGKSEKNMMILSSLLVLCGDIFISLAGQAESQKSRKSFVIEADSDEEAIVLTAADEDLDEFEYQWVCEGCQGTEECLNRSLKSYNSSLDCLTTMSSCQHETVIKRIGNANNSLAVFYMNSAMTRLYGDDEIPLSQLQGFTEKSRSYFDVALQSFENLGDNLNIVLVNVNYSKLLRLNARMVRDCLENIEGHRREFSVAERQHYTEATARYDTALQLLGSRESSPQLFDNICWELSTVYFTMACLLQDYPPISRMACQKIEEEITQLMTKSLHFCDLLRKSDAKHEPSADYRCAGVHHRLAALYHNAYRNESNSQKQRQYRLSAEKHYEESFTIFSSLDSSVEPLRLQLERVTLCDSQLSNQTSDLSRMKMLQKSLLLLLDCVPAMKNLLTHFDSTAASDTNDDTVADEDAQNEAMKLVPIIEKRTQGVLQSLTKCSSSLSKKNKSEVPLELCKSMYATSLRLVPKERQNNATELVRNLMKILEEISALYKNH